MKFLGLLIIVSTLGCISAEPESEPTPIPMPSAFTSAFWPYDLEGCMSTKDQFLERMSLKKVTWEKKYNKNCHVKSGRWVDAMTQEEFTNAKDAIVTTVIPLTYAKKNSGTAWSLHKAMSFVHDWDQLIILRKERPGEQQYLQNEVGLYVVPDDIRSRCQIVAQWQDARDRWALRAERNELLKAPEWLSECGKLETFNREEFPHWTKRKGECDSRSNTLARDVASAYKSEGCNPTDGKWLDPYSNKTLRGPASVDIDHTVPLGNAYISGAWRWNQVKKEEFANYLKDPFHLQAVSASENRRKGARHPGQYLPPNSKYQCEYLEEWLNIKFRWGLNLNPKEGAAIKEHISKKCPQMPMTYRSVIDLLVKQNLKDVSFPGTE